jgi:hypothetical protein
MDFKENIFAKMKIWSLVVFEKTGVIFRRVRPVTTVALSIIMIILGILIDKGVVWKWHDYNLQRDKFMYEIEKEQNILFYDIIQSPEQRPIRPSHHRRQGDCTVMMKGRGRVPVRSSLLAAASGV